MNAKETAFILRVHNAWRRGDESAPQMLDPKLLGEAIDSAVELIEQRDELQNELQLERNLRLGVESGFDCLCDEVKRLKAGIEYWKTIRTENAAYFEKRESEMMREAGKLDKQLLVAQAQRDQLLGLVVEMHNESTKFGSHTPIGAFHNEMGDLICRIKGGTP